MPTHEQFTKDYNQVLDSLAASIGTVGIDGAFEGHAESMPSAVAEPFRRFGFIDTLGERPLRVNRYPLNVEQI